MQEWGARAGPYIGALYGLTVEDSQTQFGAEPRLVKQLLVPTGHRGPASVPFADALRRVLQLSWAFVVHGASSRTQAHVFDDVAARRS